MPILYRLISVAPFLSTHLPPTKNVARKPYSNRVFAMLRVMSAFSYTLNIRAIRPDSSSPVYIADASSVVCQGEIAKIVTVRVDTSTNIMTRFERVVTKVFLVLFSFIFQNMFTKRWLCAIM